LSDFFHGLHVFAANIAASNIRIAI
jgi:hypothetical protein